MDLLAKHIARLRLDRPPARRGAALASALFALSAAAVLTAGVHFMTRVDIRTTRNRESAVRALAIAEAGAAHALGIMRDSLGELSYTQFLQGPDGAGANADDGLLIGRTLSSGTNGNDIPEAGRAYGGGRYTVKVVDDPADTDGNPSTDQNSRVLLRCTGFGPDGARADLDVIVAGITLPGFVFDGPLTVSSAMKTVGRCGGIHANGPITVGGSVTTSGPVTSTSTVTGTIKNESGTAVPPAQNQPVAPMPEIDANKLCEQAQYHFHEDGRVFRMNSPTDSTLLGNASSSAILGFKRPTGPPKTKWSWDSPTGNIDGSFCFKGNLEIGGTIGTISNPRRWSLYASGSVSISGNPILASFDEDSILVASGGDLQVSGNPVIGEMSAFTGALYAKHQCEISGKADINGQMLCDNEPLQDLTKTEDWAIQNIISGEAELRYGCNNKWASTRRFTGWMQR